MFNTFNKIKNWEVAIGSAFFVFSDICVLQERFHNDLSQEGIDELVRRKSRLYFLHIDCIQRISAMTIGNALLSRRPVDVHLTRIRPVLHR